MAKKRAVKKKSLAGSAAVGLTAALVTLPAVAAEAVRPPIKMGATVAFDGRSVTFKATSGEARIVTAGGRSVLHFTAKSDAIGAIFTADLPMSGTATLAGVYPLQPGVPGASAVLDVPRRSPYPAERRFAITEGSIRINSYDRITRTIGGTFGGTGTTLSGSAPIEITYGTFFDMPVR